MVELLLKRKADPAATKKQGQTAADVCKDPELQAVLREALAARQASTAASESDGQGRRRGLLCSGRGAWRRAQQAWRRTGPPVPA